MVVPDAGRGEDGILRQSISLNTHTFLRPKNANPRAFLQEMKKCFCLMAYEGPRRVEMTKFMLRGSTQMWMDLIWKSGSVAVEMTWEDFLA